MNSFEFEASITHIARKQNYMSIICQNNPFPGKIARFSANVIGTDKEKWGEKLIEGDIVRIKGNIAEAKQNMYGASYIAIYNPVILGVKRIRTETIEIPDVNTAEQIGQEGV